ncbi:MAG TPA: hypothetical protein VKI17_08605 [Gemmataceae bacterium]|nr:hypothetical protein [Gemmataceae bacterium]
MKALLFLLVACLAGCNAAATSPPAAVEEAVLQKPLAKPSPVASAALPVAKEVAKPEPKATAGECGMPACDCGCRDGKDCVCGKGEELKVLPKAGPEEKTCPCSPACTCGCNAGEPCRCGNATSLTAPSQIFREPAVRYQPAGRVRWGGTGC